MIYLMDCGKFAKIFEKPDPHKGGKLFTRTATYTRHTIS